MPLILAALLAPLALLAGPLVTPGAAPPLPHERQSEPLRPPRTKTRSAAPASPVAASPLVAQGARAEAALDAGDFAGALAAIDAAPAGKDPDGNDPVGADGADRGRLAVLRARALVGLGRESEAEAPLAAARAALPADAQVWLLSATLSRRLNRLGSAQAQIEKADELLPSDPAIALEAGLIAVLSGHDAAARKSWQSVLTVAPDSEAAATARGYLAQLDPPKATSR